MESLETNAKTRGHLAGCNAIFLETNSAEKVLPQQDVMDPSVRHRVFHRSFFCSLASFVVWVWWLMVLFVGWASGWWTLITCSHPFQQRLRNAGPSSSPSSSPLTSQNRLVFFIIYKKINIIKNLLLLLLLVSFVIYYYRRLALRKGFIFPQLLLCPSFVISGILVVPGLYNFILNKLFVYTKIKF